MYDILIDGTMRQRIAALKFTKIECRLILIRKFEENCECKTFVRIIYSNSHVRIAFGQKDFFLFVCFIFGYFSP